jgi:hypothetical protein
MAGSMRERGRRGKLNFAPPWLVLVMDAAQLEKATDRYWATMERHKLYVSEHGEDMPQVRNWKWGCVKVHCSGGRVPARSPSQWREKRHAKIKLA